MVPDAKLFILSKRPIPSVPLTFGFTRNISEKSMEIGLLWSCKM